MDNLAVVADEGHVEREDAGEQDGRGAVLVTQYKTSVSRLDR